MHFLNATSFITLASVVRIGSLKVIFILNLQGNCTGPYKRRGCYMNLYSFIPLRINQHSQINHLHCPKIIHMLISPEKYVSTGRNQDSVQFSLLSCGVTNRHHKLHKHSLYIQHAYNMALSSIQNPINLILQCPCLLLLQF